MTDDKKSDRSFPATYNTGAVVHVKAASLMQTDDILLLQQNALEIFLYGGGMLGTILRPSNTRMWEILRSLGRLLPLAEGGYLDVDKIDDPDEICRIFFTRTVDRDEETGAVTPTDPESPYKPSEVARLHGLNFYGLEGVLYQARQGANRRYLEERANLEQATQEAPTETPQTETEKPARKRRVKSTPPDSALLATA